MPAMQRRPSTQSSSSTGVAPATGRQRGSLRGRGQQRGQGTTGQDSSMGGWGAGLDTGLEGGAQGATLAEIRNGAVLEPMAEGPAVQWVQAALTRLGFPVAQTGINGSMTETLISKFQRINGVQSNGRVGPTPSARWSGRSMPASPSGNQGPRARRPGGQAPGVPSPSTPPCSARASTPTPEAAYLAHSGTSPTASAPWRSTRAATTSGAPTSATSSRATGGASRAGAHPDHRAPQLHALRPLAGEDLVANPHLAATPEVGYKVAAEYWKDNDLNALADSGRFGDITRRINGGTRGWEDRNRRHRQAQDVLAASRDKPKVAVQSQAADVRGSMGSAGSALAIIQGALAEARAALGAGDLATAKDRAHAAAEAARRARSDGGIPAEQAEPGQIVSSGPAHQQERGGAPAASSGESVATRARSARRRRAFPAGQRKAAKAGAHAVAQEIRRRIETGEQRGPATALVQAGHHRADQMELDSAVPARRRQARRRRSRPSGHPRPGERRLEAEDYKAARAKAHTAAETARRDQRRHEHRRRGDHRHRGQIREAERKERETQPAGRAGAAGTRSTPAARARCHQPHDGRQRRLEQQPVPGPPLRPRELLGGERIRNGKNRRLQA